MKTVLLYGDLGRRFGRVHRLDVASPAEAMRALRANDPGFMPYMLAHSEPGYRVITGGKARTLETLAHPFGDRESLRVVPLVAGSGNAFNFVLGATLMIFAPEIGAFAGSMFEGAGADILFAAQAGTFIASAAGSLGLSMVLGGVAQLLFAPPSAQGASAGATSKSYAFAGVVNTVAQGATVPICYGRLMVGSAVISAGLVTEETT